VIHGIGQNVNAAEMLYLASLYIVYLIRSSFHYPLLPLACPNQKYMMYSLEEFLLGRVFALKPLICLLKRGVIHLNLFGMKAWWKLFMNPSVEELTVMIHRLVELYRDTWIIRAAFVKLTSTFRNQESGLPSKKMILGLIL